MKVSPQSGNLSSRSVFSFFFPGVSVSETLTDLSNCHVALAAGCTFLGCGSRCLTSLESCQWAGEAPLADVSSSSSSFVDRRSR